MDGNFSILDNISNKVNIISIPIERKISLYLDFKALFLLIAVFNKNRFFIAHSVSPKAGLLCAIAAWIAKIPNRLHTFTGQVWVTKKGISRWFLKLLDKIIVLLNTKILVDSFSQQDFLANENVLSKKYSLVLGQGSISGVDINRFLPSKKYRSLIRNELKINGESIIFLFVGRLKKKKEYLSFLRHLKVLVKFMTI